MPLTDLRALAPAHRDAAARRIATQQVSRPFDLEQGPLLRAGLLRTGDRDHVLWLAMHHIVADAWSIDLLVHEVGVLYRRFAAERAGREPSATGPHDNGMLDPLPVQYADFAAWQRESLTPEVLRQLSSFWRRRLAGAPPQLKLRCTRHVAVAGAPRGAKRTLPLPESVAAGATALGRRQGVTAFMTLLAVFDVLLSYHAETSDVVVGTNTANRTHAQTARLIGFFVNQLVLRTDLSGDPSFRELLERVRETALSAYAHQDMPFEQLVADLRAKRDDAHSPLFQVKFELRETADRVLELPNLTLEPIDTDHIVVRHDLHMIVSHDRAGLAATLLYDARLFDESTIADLLEEFRVLAELAVANPDSTVTELHEVLSRRRSGKRAAAARSLQALSTEMLRSRRRRAAAGV